MKRYSVIAFATTAAWMFMTPSMAQDPLPVPDVPATPVNPDTPTNSAHLDIDLRITDAVRLEAAAKSILINKSKYTAAEAKALLRPFGELDIPRCIYIIVGARLAVATDGFKAIEVRIAPNVIGEPAQARF